MSNEKSSKTAKKQGKNVFAKLKAKLKTGIKTEIKTKVNAKLQSAQDEMHEPGEVLHDSSSESKTSDFYVACVGASAGGLAAITEFISDFPSDSGVALVFIQHLPDESKTILTELLKNRTRLPVHEAEDKMEIQPNNLYVIPSARNMTIDKNGKLKLVKRNALPLRYSIDEVFNAIALVAGEKAIGVVLSGTASDGTLGLKAIQAGGGITFAQNEASSEYADMPHHAMATGAADYILPPKEIAKKIVEISHFDQARAVDIKKTIKKNQQSVKMPITRSSYWSSNQAMLTSPFTDRQLSSAESKGGCFSIR